jgi:cobalt-zinc-cadmium efflux system outer membrane protein
LDGKDSPFYSRTRFDLSSCVKPLRSFLRIEQGSLQPGVVEMRRSWIKMRSGLVAVTGMGLVAGCAHQEVSLPAGHVPPQTSAFDAHSTQTLAAPAPDSQPTKEPVPKAEGKHTPFELPAAIPGADSKPIISPRFEKGTTPEQRDEATKKQYPELIPVAATSSAFADGAPLSLADLQQIALTNSPRIRQANAESQTAYGQVLQAGLYPNPTIGYQVDQWQPNLKPAVGSGVGQQGGFINQLIKTAGKLTLAQQVAGYDYINSLVAVRRAQVDVISQVRNSYFTALVAKRSLEINKSLADMADQVYQLQLKRVAAGIASSYEPLQLYAQAVQARNAHTIAEANYKSSWRQLAAAVGQPNLPISTLTGDAEVPAPSIDWETTKVRVVDHHTEMLTARNTASQAQSNLTLQRRMPIPDLQTNTYHQYDNLAQTYQFGVQLGIDIPVFDRNQGNIWSAKARISAANENIRTIENSLVSRLSEAYGRYESATKVADNFHDKVLPGLSQAYRGIIRQYQLEPDKIGFNDIVVAQQNLGQALQQYLAALDNQWKAVVDLANLAQWDEIYPEKTAEK